jgi:hypothetical protein
MQQQLHDTYGITFTPAQGVCLGDAFVAQPMLLNALKKEYTPPPAMAEQFVALLVQCLGDVPAGVHAVIEAAVKLGQMTAAQGTCLEGVLRVLPQADLVLILANDPNTILRYQAQIQPCAAGATEA